MKIASACCLSFLAFFPNGHPALAPLSFFLAGILEDETSMTSSHSSRQTRKEESLSFPAIHIRRTILMMNFRGEN